MNRLAWHIPFGIALSVSAHLSLITLLNGGINWSLSGISLPDSSSHGTTAPRQWGASIEPVKETHPVHSHPTEKKESPTAILKQAATPAGPKNLKRPPRLSESDTTRQQPEERLALPLPIKVDGEKYPVLFEN